MSESSSNLTLIAFILGLLPGAYFAFLLLRGIIYSMKKEEKFD
jgi:hypothetical protein